MMAPDLAGKRLELLRDILPGLARVAVLWESGNPYTTIGFKETEVAARTLGVEMQSLEVRSPDDFDRAFETAQQQHPDALVTVDGPLTLDHIKLIVDFAAAQRLPSVHGAREFATAGGFLSYGTNIPDVLRRAAGYVDKILRGAKPADLPVEQPTKFKLVLNLKTANAFGIGFPQSLILSADEMIGGA